MTENPLTRTLARMSPSKVECAAKCLAQFAFRYIERVTHPLWNSSIVLGRALDTATGAAYTAKAVTGTTPSADDVAARFAAEWDMESETVERWDDGDTAGGLMDWGTRAGARWRDEIAQFVRPRAVQPKLERDVFDPRTGDRWTMSGFADQIGELESTGQPIVTDLKVSGRRYSADRITRGWQPAFYTLMADIPTFQFHVLVQNKAPAVQVIGATFTAADHAAVVSRTAMLRRQIRNAHATGDWLPNRTHTLCSRRYCEHWRACEQRHGGRVPD